MHILPGPYEKLPTPTSTCADAFDPIGSKVKLKKNLLKHNYAIMLWDF